MTEWFHITECPPPFDVEVLACDKDYPNMWVAKIYKENPEEFTPTICTCCEYEPHNFIATHWRYLPKRPK